MAHLCIARHGETDWNLQGVLQGWIDVPINELGRNQAVEMATSIRASGIDVVCSSPLIRARETAEIISEHLGLPAPRCHDGLRERRFGAIQGIPKAELGELNPVLLQHILKRNPATHFEDGETMDEFADRVLSAIIDIGEMHAGQRVFVITHGWVMDVVTRHVRDLPRFAILNLKRKNGETLWLDVSGQTVAQLHYGTTNNSLSG
jgi:2,3-bisphosphoglycerate-dependent phosphoglycerate mutase